MSSSSRICVAVRKRPIPDPENDIVECASPKLVLNEPKIKYDLTPYTDRHTFTFDQVFAETCNNTTIYQRCCLPLIETVFSHGNATCFAYGQTGSGKTYTMLGSQKEPGLYAIAAREIFSRANKISAEVYVSFYEIYGRKIFDLLNNRERLFAREDADKVINICGLSEHKVTDIQEIFDVITAGSVYRAAGQTSANSESSRSHAVLQIEVREGKPTGRRGPKTIGRISFIDLAGNERGADTFDCDRKTRMEGAEINKSLLALKECIRALGMGKSHVPFRGSILTEVLRDSFTGNSRTTMIATISPTSHHCVNTLNTLRYTQRVKELGGNGGAAKIEQVPASPPRRQAVAARRKPSETPQPAKPRPDWVNDFAAGDDSGDTGDTAEPNVNRASPTKATSPTPQQQRRPSNRAGKPVAARPAPPAAAAGGGGGGCVNVPVSIMVRDPKIATILQKNIAALEPANSDEDSDDDEEDEVPNEEAGGAANAAASDDAPLPKSEVKQVRKVHAYVVDEITKAEEKLVALHRRHIDAKMSAIKDEIRAIQAFEESDSVDEYVAKIRSQLSKQKEDMDQLLSMLDAIGAMLKDEEDLSNTLSSSVRKRY